MQIAILVYPGFTALDAIGPYEVLSRLPGATLAFVSATPGPINSDTGFLSVIARGLDDMPVPDVIIVPGGIEGTFAAASNAQILSWLKSAARHAQWVASVCTGAIILGAAGLLEGKRATTHWLATSQLEALGAEFEEGRVIVDGKLVTSQGVSAGIDMALELAGKIAGEPTARAIQLFLEYDPQPPFDSGSVAKADPATIAAAMNLARPTPR